jgi:hypothetical protein
VVALLADTSFGPFQVRPLCGVRVFARPAAGNAEARMRSSEREGELQRIRRRIAETWRDTPRKALALETLDRLVWEAYKASNDAA